MPFLTALPPETTVIATVDFGPIARGQRGIITARRLGTWWPWRWTVYVCTFLGGISVSATRLQIRAHDHGLGRGILENPLWFLRTRDAVFACDLARREQA